MERTAFNASMLLGLESSSINGSNCGLAEVLVLESVRKAIKDKKRWESTIELTLATFNYLGMNGWKTNAEKVMFEDGQEKQVPCQLNDAVLSELQRIMSKRMNVIEWLFRRYNLTNELKAYNSLSCLPDKNQSMKWKRISLKELETSLIHYFSSKQKPMKAAQNSAPQLSVFESLITKFPFITKTHLDRVRTTLVSYGPNETSKNLQVKVTIQNSLDTLKLLSPVSPLIFDKRKFQLSPITPETPNGKKKNNA